LEAAGVRFHSSSFPGLLVLFFGSFPESCRMESDGDA
jgi:hypothetical protein